jgi:transcriptional regulator with GAF, ATPase, and Fis domain
MTVGREVAVEGRQQWPGLPPAVSREMFRQADVAQTLVTVARLARQAFFCDAATVELTERETLVAAAATDSAVGHASELQYRLGEGPGLDAVVVGEVLVVDDLRLEGRYPSWAPRAAELGWSSVVAVPLAEDDVTAALSLYGRSPRSLRQVDLALVEVFAAHAALALAAASERDHLTRAVQTRGLIGQAQGILMQRYDIEAEQAFTVMRRYSSHLNRKLRDVASDVVRDRAVPRQADWANSA